MMAEQVQQRTDLQDLRCDKNFAGPSVTSVEDSVGLSASAIRTQLGRLQSSSTFAASCRLVAFLRFVVDETVGGRSASLKEAVIGFTVYERDPPYDPRIDSTVRVEARRLRRKLKEYYDTEGRSDPVKIDLPTGRYIPSFTLNEYDNWVNDPRDPDSRGRPTPDHASRPKAAIIIMPFLAMCNNSVDEVLADGLTDDLTFAVAQMDRLQVTSFSAAFQYKGRAYSIPEIAGAFGVDAVLQGTVRRDGKTVRVTVEVSNSEGFVVWSARFNSFDSELASLREKIAQTVLTSVHFQKPACWRSLRD
jgi:TolB-like protein